MRSIWPNKETELKNFWYSDLSYQGHLWKAYWYATVLESLKLYAVPHVRNLENIFQSGDVRCKYFLSWLSVRGRICTGLLSSLLVFYSSHCHVKVHTILKARFMIWISLPELWMPTGFLVKYLFCLVYKILKWNRW